MNILHAPSLKLALLAGVLSLSAAHRSDAVVIAQDSFSSASGGTGLAGSWSTDFLTFSSAGATTAAGAFYQVNTTRLLSSAHTLSGSNTWIAAQMNVASNQLDEGRIFALQPLFNVGTDDGNNLLFGSGYTAPGGGELAYYSLFRNGGGFQGFAYGTPTAPPIATATWLTRITASGANISVEGWIFTSSSLPGTDPTGAANGAAYYGSFSFDPVGTGTDLTGFLLNAYNVEGTYQQFIVGTDYSDVAAIPEPGTWALFAIGLAATFLVRRRSATRRIS